MRNARFLTLVGIVLAAAAARLAPHPPNFTPIAAMALFGGAHFTSRGAAFGVPLAAMFLSDLFLGSFVYGSGWFHSTMPFVYAGFALIVCLGVWVRGRPSLLRVGGATVAGSVIFFLLTNFGVWLAGGLYPGTWDGLIACYVAAIPFFGRTLAGDILYVGLLFGGFALVRRFWPVLGEEAAPAREPAAAPARG